MTHFSLKASSFLRFFLLTLALLCKGQEGQASHDDHEDEGIPSATVTRPKGPAAAVAIKDVFPSASGLPLSHLESLPNEILMEVLLNLDVPSFSALSQTSFYLKQLVMSEYFQDRFSGMKSDVYNNIINKSIPALFGEPLGEIIKTALGVLPPYAYGEILKNLVSQKNTALLKQSNSYFINKLFPKEKDTYSTESKNIVKRLVIASQATQFCAYVDRNEQTPIINALIPFNPWQIIALAQNNDKLFTLYMTGNDRAEIITDFLPLSAWQIKIVARNNDKLFPGIAQKLYFTRALALLNIEKLNIISQNANKFFTNMTKGSTKVLIINVLQDLSAQQIKDVSASLKWNVTVKERLEKIALEKRRPTTLDYSHSKEVPIVDFLLL